MINSLAISDYESLIVLPVVQRCLKYRSVDFNEEHYQSKY